MKTIDVELPDGGRSYSIHVGHDILSQLGGSCRELSLGKRVAVITDQSVAARAGQATASLKEAGFDVFEVPFTGGDAAKSMQSAEDIVGHLIRAELDRGSWIAAIGGGVTGDLGGFVAATFLRGVDIVHVPTTIVAQVDSSIGGKTAVNHPLGKNIIGAYHQPRMVFADTEFLRILPRAERVSGMAEVVKHAIVRDAELFAFLEENLQVVVDMEIAADDLDWLISRNAQIKATVVQADEREVGLRAILNYGHTIGHAIEAAGLTLDPDSDYGRYRHGEAVILGMAAAGEIAAVRGLWSKADQQRQDTLLTRLGMPSGIAEVPADLILERTRADKKRVNGRLRFVLGRRIGEVEIVDDVDEETVRQGIAYIQSTYR